MKHSESIPRIPSLPALRAFESAARSGSFSAAAAELNLTQGAVGAQVRALEQELGVALFDRIGRGLTLSQEGQLLAQRVRAALTELARATQEVRRGRAHDQLVLSVLPSFASAWLVPRAAQFAQLHPELNLVIHSTTAVVDFCSEPVDLCIRFGVGPWDGLWQEHLLDDAYFPVCAPALARELASGTPDGLLQAPLLCCLDEPWMPWFLAAGAPCPREPRGLMFSDAVNLLQAAKQGQGVALARQSLVRDDLASGALVRLSPISVRCPMSYHLVCPHSMAQSHKVQKFRRWIRAELLADAAHMDAKMA